MQGASGALETFEHCVEQGWVLDGVISTSEAQAQQLWRLREGITESVARYKPYKNDVSVRISAMPAFLAETQKLLGEAYPHFDVVWFGHIGDGNLHINVLKPDDTSDADFVAQCEHVTKLLAQVLGGDVVAADRLRPVGRAGPHRRQRGPGGGQAGGPVAGQTPEPGGDAMPAKGLARARAMRGMSRSSLGMSGIWMLAGRAPRRSVGSAMEKGSLRCVHTMRSGSQGVRPATRTQHQAA